MGRLAIALCVLTTACTFDTSSGLVDPNSLDPIVDAAFSGGSNPDGSAPGFDARPPAFDAAPGPVDAATPLSLCLLDCTGPGASCTLDGTCEYNCTGNIDCGNINCPPGRPCNVHCERSGQNAAPCNNVVCAPNQPCNVTCVDATDNDLRVCNNVSCNGSCACDVQCTGSDNACNSTNCTQDCSDGNDCSAEGSCNTCSL